MQNIDAQSANENVNDKRQRRRPPPLDNSKSIELTQCASARSVLLNGKERRTCMSIGLYAVTKYVVPSLKSADHQASADYVVLILMSRSSIGR